MRKGCIVCLWLLAFAAAAAAQSDRARSGVGDEYLGKWTGTWSVASEGAAGGEFEMTITRDKDGAPVGNVVVSGGQDGHSATFKSLAFTGRKMTARYDYPLDEGGEIALEATFDGSEGAGTWVLHPPGQAGEVSAQGTWKVARK
ncbi:MAG: hypothetical protein V7647_808 [Acidobacteriota bacterium]|jgi:hypothetical protein